MLANVVLANEIRRRGVFYIGGYDPKTPEAFFERLDKERARYETLWGVTTERGPIEDREGLPAATIRAEGGSAGGHWQVETDLHFFSLEEIVQRDFADPIFVRFARYLVTVADYVATGTFFRFMRHAWRFAGYFLYPFVMALLLAAVCFVPAFLLSAAVPPTTFETPGGSALRSGVFVVAFALFFVLLAKLGPRYFVPHLMDLWSFSRNWLRGHRSDAEALFAGYGAAMARAAAAGNYDEIVLVGHSTGGALILQIAHDALAADPAFARAAPRVTILTVGSTALKIGLHPAAKSFRENVAALQEAGLSWVEYQAVADIINFEGTDPVALMGIRRTNPDFGRTARVRMRSLLEPATYRRIKRNFFRVHYQFVFANTVGNAYDFHSICFGPLALLERARHPRAVVDHLGQS